MKIEKWREGVYRVRNCDVCGLPYDNFGQIKKQGREWLLEIRNTTTGNLIRYAGTHSTLAAAKDEAECVIEQMEYESHDHS